MQIVTEMALSIYKLVFFLLFSHYQFSHLPIYKHCNLNTVAGPPVTCNMCERTACHAYYACCIPELLKTSSNLITEYLIAQFHTWTFVLLHLCTLSSAEVFFGTIIDYERQ